MKKTRSCKVTSGECKWNETCQFQVKEGVNIFTLSIALIFIYKGGLMMMVSSPRGLYNGIIPQLGQSLKVSVWKLQQTPMKCKNKQVHNMSLRSVPR